MGSNVVSGFATAVVVNTGPRPYFGTLAHTIVGAREETSTRYRDCLIRDSAMG